MSFAFPQGLGPLTPTFPGELAADGLVLRTPTHDDVERIAPAFLDPAVGGEAGLPPFGEEQLHAFVEHQLGPWRASGLLVPYLIVEDVPVGGATLHHLDPTREVIEVGYWLFTDARGRGLATRTVAALVEWAFGNGFYRVEAMVRIGNAASERVLERNGFVREGVKRRFLRHAGGRVDSTLFSRLADDS